MRIDPFKRPTAAYRGKPFWAWNGKLRREELIRQVHIMKEMGFGGFFMHSRTGLQTEYLSDEWFDDINACADEAERLGMEAWLYDEDRWPSGTAGGAVTSHPEHRMKSLVLHRKPAAEFTYDARCVAAFSAETKGVTLLSYQRIFSQDEIDPSSEILYFTIEETASASFYNGYTYLDTLSREATDAFLKSTHEKYKEKCGERFGSSIKGIFTDEPNRGDVMCNFQSRLKKENNNIAWTGKLFQEFNSLYHYDIVDKLPELFLRLGGEPVSPVKWQYLELLQRLFIKNFLKPINDWCNENNIILTGHVLHENTLANQTAVFGSVMRAYEYMGIPGIDMLTENDNSYWVAKQLSSVTRQLDIKWALSELYGCVGWQMPFAGYKAVGDWQALFGVNLRCPHLSWYTMEGEAKRDCPGSILHQSAWYSDYPYIEDYFSRFNQIMTKGRAVCDVAVIHPVESVWAEVYPGWANGLWATDEALLELEAKFKELFGFLAGAGIDFDYADEDILSRHFSITDDTLKIGGASYGTVIVSGCVTLRESTVTILEKFKEAGGNVIFLGEPPQYVDCVKSDRLSLMAESSISAPFKRDSVVTAVLSCTDVPAKINGGNGDIFMQARRDGNDSYFAFLNINRTKKHEKVALTLQGEGQAQLWDCRTGNRCILGETTDRCFKIDCDFFPAQELFIVIKEEREELPSVSKAEYSPIREASLPTAFAYSLSEENICVLDFAKITMDGEKSETSNEILKLDDMLRRKFGLEQRGGEMLQPWYKKYVLNTPVKSYAGIRLDFDFCVAAMPEKNLTLALEHPEWYHIAVNGQAIDSEPIDGFYWVDTCFKGIPLPVSALRPGENIVTLELDFTDESELEAIYLLGDFGVSLDANKKTLCKLQDKLSLSDLAVQALPFYTGKIIYHIPCDFSLDKAQKCVLSVSFDGACVKLIDSENEQLCGFAPYELDVTSRITGKKPIRLELSLTRRNTFGPLHQLPVLASGYSSGNYHTDGDEFTDSYALVDSGLKGITAKIWEAKV